VNNFAAALDCLQKAQQADPANPEATRLEASIQSLQRYLGEQEKK
jgi:hypothetical protein